MTALEVVWDVTGANLARVRVPAGIGLAGYVTGTGTVPWTHEELAAHPGVVWIDQSPADTAHDETADVFDCEPGAGTLSALPAWYRAAVRNFQAAARPGQRWPCVYASRSVLTPVANAFIAAGIDSGPCLWVAAPGISADDAAVMLMTSGGPFPVVGVQVAQDAGGGAYDVSLFRSDWLAHVSSKFVPPPPEEHGVVLTGPVRPVVSRDGGRTWV